MKRLSTLAGILCTLCCMSIPASALTVHLDYTHDTYFGTNPTAKATLEAAAADLSAAITTTFAPVTTGSYTGTNDSTTATFNWYYSYTNPTTGASVDIDPGVVSNDRVDIFVGVRNLLGSTLGTGGPSGIGFSLEGSGFPYQWPGAVDGAEAQSEAAYMRGGGPVMGNVSGSSYWSGYTAYYDIDYTTAYGSLWFDVDENNDGIQDTAGMLANYWHFDYSTPVGVGKNDLYSVALHEMLHALGIGTADSWDDLVSGTTWNGTEVQAITGTGANMINAAGDHIASGTMSTRISDGAAQEVVMDPTLTVGTRKSLTALDLAFLRDIGYDTIVPVVEDPDFDSDGDVDGADFLIWQRGSGLNGQTDNSNGDANGDGTVDAADLAVWQGDFGTATAVTLPAGTAVPEPGSALLMFLAASGLLARRR